MTAVLFYNEPGAGIMAVFPKEYWTDKSRDTFTCYAHIGQHSAVHKDYLKECTLATKDEYSDLQKELESIGYKLKIIRSL